MAKTQMWQEEEKLLAFVDITPGDKLSSQL